MRWRTGAVVVAAAGNESADVEDFTPANCSGVITVAAHTQDGTLTSYSNFGTRIDVSAPGGDLPIDRPHRLDRQRRHDGSRRLRLRRRTRHELRGAAGVRDRGADAGPQSDADGGRVLDIVTGTARDFPFGSICARCELCGVGLLDAGVAVGSTLPGGSTPPPGAFQVVEYYRADLDHYFITAHRRRRSTTSTRSCPACSSGRGCISTRSCRRSRRRWDSRPVCRFYAQRGLINSHYFSASSSECQFVLAHWPGIWNLETATAFYIQVPDSNGGCPAGTLPVYRFFNNRHDANHRYTVDLSVRRAMLNRGWVPEGNGPNAVAFCSVF